MKHFIRKSLKSKVEFYKEKISKLILRKRVRNYNFTIISSNCWGSRIYQELGIKYNTPFIGSFFVAPCYIRLLSSLKYYLNSEIKFVNKSKYSVFNEIRKNHNNYPIGLLRNDVEIHFQHYHSEIDAERKWLSRLQRMNMDNLFVSFTDRDLCSERLLVAFDNMPFKQKICFTAKQYPQIRSAIHLPEYKDESYIGDIYTNHHIYKRHFDVAGWLNGGTGRKF